MAEKKEGVLARTEAKLMVVGGAIAVVGVVVIGGYVGGAIAVVGGIIALAGYLMLNGAAVKSLKSGG